MFFHFIVIFECVDGKIDKEEYKIPAGEICYFDAWRDVLDVALEVLEMEYGERWRIKAIYNHVNNYRK